MVYLLFMDYRDVFLIGLARSFYALLAGIVLASVLGLACALLTYNDRGAINKLIRLYITIIRNTPFLVQLYLLYFGMSGVLSRVSGFLNDYLFGYMGFSITNAIAAGVLTITLNSGAYISDIIKAGIQAVEKGQSEAAEALGLSTVQRFRLIIFPQALPQIIPAVIGQYLIMFQDTSLMAMVSYSELTRSIMDVGNETYYFVEAFIVGGILYLVVLNVMEVLAGFVERRFGLKMPGRRMA